MPKPRKPEGYDNALSSIFDFVFKQSQQKGKKKPYRYSGKTDGSDALAKGLAELAANPAFYASNAMMSNVNESLLNNIKFLEFRMDLKDGNKYLYYDDAASRVRIRGSEIGKAFSNPRKFIDGVFDGAKDEHRWMAITGAVAYLDGAVASYMGARNGMSNREALEFGKAASMNYDREMGEYEKKLVAGNAAMKREVERARDAVYAANPSLRGKENTPQYVGAMQKELEARKGEIEKQQNALYAAMNSSASTRGKRYTGSLYDLREFDKEIDKARKEKNPAKIAEAEQAKTDAIVRFNTEIENRLQKVEENLAKSIGQTEAKKLVDQLKGEMHSQVGEGITSYRINFHNNKKLQMLFTSDPDELKRLSGAAYTALVWERLKGNVEQTGAGLSTSIEDVKGQIRDLKETIGPLTPEEQAYLKRLEQHKINLEAVAGKQAARYKKADPWIEDNEGVMRPQDKGIALEGLKEEMEVEKSKLLLEFQKAARSGDHHQTQFIQLQLKSLSESIASLDTLPLETLRFRAAKYVMQYRAMQGLMAGGMGAGLVNGTAYFTQATGMTAPGQLTAAYTWTRVKDPKTGVWKFEKMYTKDQGKQNMAPFIVMPRTDVNPYVAQMAGLYYLTPGSLLKTAFYNGEGFNYIAAMRERGIQRSFYHDRNNYLKDFFASKKGDQAFMAQFGKFYDEQGNLNMSEVASNYLEVMTLLGERSDLPAPLKSLIGKMGGKYASMNRFAKIGKLYMDYGIGGRMFLANKRFVDFRDSLMAKLGIADWRKRGLQKIFKDEAWQKAVGQFFGGSIGVKQLIQAGITAGLNALGVATGGLTTIISVAAYFATEVLYKLAKPALGVLFILVWGICGLVGFFYFMMTDFLIPTTVAHTAIVPGDITYCGVELAPPIGEPGPNPDGKPIDEEPPEDAICPINIGAACNQGPDGKWSHAKMGTFAIDVGTNAGVWKAPNDGTVTDVEPLTCPWDPGRGNSIGTKVEFTDSRTGTVYRMLHADPLVSQGAQVSQGDPIASIAFSLPYSACWTGAHFHLDTRVGGGWVDSEAWYNGLGCNLMTCPN